MESYRVEVSSILEVLGETVEVSDTLALPELTVGDERFVARGPVRFDVSLTNTGAAIITMGRVVYPVLATCARCLCEFPTEISAELDGFYVMPGEDKDLPEEQEIEYIDAEGAIDLSPALMAALVLEAPFAPLHAEDCAGICVECGADLNEGDCGCMKAVDAAKNPFAALGSLISDDVESP
jgi:uncharacterized protein